MQPDLRSLTVALVLVAGATAGCSLGDDGDRPESAGATAPPCDHATRADLGTPRRGGPMALFTTSGGTIHVTVDGIDSSGVLDSSTSTAIDIGPAATPPTYDAQRGTVKPLTATASVHQGRYTAVRLARGSYWLWSSNGGTVGAAACPPTTISAVTEAGKPAPFSQH